MPLSNNNVMDPLDSIYKSMYKNMTPETLWSFPGLASQNMAQKPGGTQLVGSFPGYNPGGGDSAFGKFFGEHGSTVLDFAQGLGGLFMGMKQYGLAKKALNHSREQFNKNFAAQQKTVNAAMEDRQAARVASNPNAYESVGVHMDKHRV